MRTVLLHPHPDYGGNQHNAVIATLYEALPDAVRFDFASSDLEVAKAQAVDALGDGPSWVVGYSFGGGVAAMVDDPRVAGWYLIAPALYAPVIGPDPRPKAVLAAEQDRHFSPDDLRAATADWTASTVDVVRGADHHFHGLVSEVVHRCARWLETVGR